MKEKKANTQKEKKLREEKQLGSLSKAT